MRNAYAAFLSQVEASLKNQNLSLTAVARRAGLRDNTLYRLASSEPKIGRVAAICGALGLEFYIGPPRDAESAPPADAPGGFARFAPAIDIPARGYAKCSLYGHLEGEREFPDLPMPEGAMETDTDAFFVIAKGKSMVPEGIESGDYCLVSPNTAMAPGLRVWLKDRQGRAAVKRLMEVDDKTYALRGWLDPDGAGRQREYVDQWMRLNIQEQGVVLAVYRGKPDANSPPPLIPDPKAPDVAAPREITNALNLPDGATISEAVAEIERFVNLPTELAAWLAKAP